jgi:hypothetical protein
MTDLAPFIWIALGLALLFTLVDRFTRWIDR